MNELPTVYYIAHPPPPHGHDAILEELPRVRLGSVGDMLRQSLRRQPRPRLIFVDTFGRWGLYAWLLSLLWRTPLVIWVRGELFREQRDLCRASSGLLRWPRYWWRTGTGWLCFRRAALIIPNSRYMRQALAPWIRGTPTAVVHPPYREPKTPAGGHALPLPTTGLHLLTVMDLEFSAKFDLTLEAMIGWLPEPLWDELDIHWALCGDGRQMARVRDAIAATPHAARIHLLGWVDGMAGAFTWGHVLVHLTRLDAFPNATKEAAMAALPIVTNEDSCGTREQVRHAETGYLVNGPEAFADAITTYAADADLRRRHGEAGRAFHESHFSLAIQRRAMTTVLASHFPGKQ